MENCLHINVTEERLIENEEFWKYFVEKYSRKSGAGDVEHVATQKMFFDRTSFFDGKLPFNLISRNISSIKNSPECSENNNNGTSYFLFKVPLFP